MLLRPLPADERCAAAPSPRMPAGSLPHLPAGVWRCLDGGGSAARAPWPCLQWVHTCACPATPCAPASALLCCIHTTPPAPARMCPPASCPRAALTPPAPPLLLLSLRPLPRFPPSLPPPQFYFETIFPRVPKPGAPLRASFPCLHRTCCVPQNAPRCPPSGLGPWKPRAALPGTDQHPFACLPATVLSSLPCSARRDLRALEGNGSPHNGKGQRRAG